MIEVSCPHCGYILETDEYNMAKIRWCFKCNRDFELVDLFDNRMDKEDLRRTQE